MRVFFYELHEELKDWCQYYISFYEIYYDVIKEVQMWFFSQILLKNGDKFKKKAFEGQQML